MSHPDKEKIINLVNRCLKRSGLTIDQVVARMQADGCDVSRSSFENHFTTRADRRPNASSEYVVALIAALTNGLTNSERCPATEALELARLTRLPIDQFRAVKNYFPLAEFLTAYKLYGPGLELTPAEMARLELMDAQGVDGRCPYRGLQAFDEEHAEFFFGREADIEWLLAGLQHSRFLAVVGPSGSGKSSVVKAGLIPALRQGALADSTDSSQSPVTPLIQIVEPGQQPLETLAAALADYTKRSQVSLIEQFRTGAYGLHQLALKILTHHSDNSQLVLVVDQFEELFTLCRDEAERQAFIANLLQAALQFDSRMVVILTMRADFYGQAAAYPNLAVYLAENQVLLSPMTESELRQAIICPAQRVGIHFESGLVDQLLKDAAAEPGALPLLQHTLLELWERRQGTELTLAAYQSIGRVHGALARRADTVLAEFSPEQLTIVRRIMLRLTRLGEATADTRRRATFAELIRTPDEAVEVREVVTRLADARLVTTSANRETGKELVDVAHEALIRGWPILQAWLTEDRESLYRQQQLAEAALEWDQNAREGSYLYAGARLAAVEEWATRHEDEMNPLEHDFLTTSLAERDRRTKEREQQQRRVIRVLTVSLASILIALAVAVGFAFFAFDQQQQVEIQRQETLSRQLAAQALDLIEDYFDRALLLSAQAYQIANTVEARSALLETLQTSPRLTQYLRGHTDWVWSVAFNPAGNILASGSADGTIILWDVDSRQPLGPPLTGHTGWVRSVSFSSDGQMLASGSADGTIILWDVSTILNTSISTSVAAGRPLGSPLSGHSSFVTDVAFSPNGKTLASSSADGTVMLWDVATATPLGPPLTGHTSLVLSVAFSPDGQTLASGGADQTIILWDISHYSTQDNQMLAQALTNHTRDVFSLAFSPDGHTLASGSADGTIILWDVETHQPRQEPLAGHKSGVNTIVFSPDGQTLVSGSEDKTLMLWNVATGQPLGDPLIGHAEGVLGLAYSPAIIESADNQTSISTGIIASGSADGTVILWDISSVLNRGISLPWALSKELDGHSDLVWSVAFSPDGRILASGSRDSTIVLWDLAANRPLGAPLTGHTGLVTAVAFSPDGRLLASASDDRTVILWDIATRQPLGPPLAKRDSPVGHVFFVGDGELLLSGDEDGIVIMWDVETHQALGEFLPKEGKLLALSPDGQTLARAPDGNAIHLWNFATRRPLSQPWTNPANLITNLAFGPTSMNGTDSELLASGGTDGVILLWNVATSQPIDQPLVKHTDEVIGLAFNPNSSQSTAGHVLASGSNDGTAILWDIPSLQPLGLPFIVGERVRSVVFSPDGQTLATAGRNDGSIILWNVNPESWQKRACQIATRNLTPAEWKRYLSDEPYRLTCPNAPEPDSHPEEAIVPRTLTGVSTPIISGTINAIPGAIVEEFDSDRDFIQTSDDVYIAGGQVKWHFKRDGGKQYVYRHIPPFSGNVRLTARGQVDSWTNNCTIQAGIGDTLGSGVAVIFGWTGGGCSTNGPIVLADGVTLDNKEPSACEYVGNWLWIDNNTPYTADLTVEDGGAVLAVEGVGQSTGIVNYEGPYTTLWVGNNGRGDWPECTGTIDSVIVEPLN